MPTPREHEAGEPPGGAAGSREQFAANLRRYRTRAGISQERLALGCGLHRTEISLLERAGRDPRLSTIVRLADCLGVAPAALLEDVD
ncbi:MAG: helix-turn-helix transcriptional regulator [Thermoleophilia bacterium]|nr:helix-turn-helix transcriptional regulator [Thermoleophilia bacterium]